VANPLSITYQVLQYRIAAADTTTTPSGAVFAPTRIVAAGGTYQYKRIDVTVVSGSDRIGIGSRLARVSGLLTNPSPGTNFAVADGCALGAPAPCP